MLWILIACHSRMPEVSSPAETATTEVLTWQWLTATPGALSTCGITTDGALICWGEMEPGLGASSGLYWSPLGDDPVEASVVSTGTNHGCILDPTGKPRCWQNNPAGTNGPDLTAALNEPTGPLQDIATPIGETCGLSPAGELRCWGGWGSGVWDLSGTYQSITSGLDELCAVTTSGDIACWQTYQSLDPIPSLPGTIAISTEMTVACTLDSDHQPHCFGSGLSDFPVPSSAPLHSIDVSPKVICGITEQQTISCWGPEAEASLKPPQGIWSEVSCSVFHCCALATDGTASCWGDNSVGQLDIPDAGDLR